MARSHSISQLARSFARLKPRECFLLIEAAACLLGARLALFLVPFSFLSRGFGTFVSPMDHRVAGAALSVPNAQDRLASQIGWAVTRAARHVPFPAVCLPQAIAAKLMLGRRGRPSVLHFGAIMKEGQPLETHAWLDADGVTVTGYQLAKEAIEIGCFV